MKKVLIYLRVSRKEEDVENQRIAISKFAKENKYQIVKEFPDEDVSGWKVQVLKRDGFNKLMKYAEQHNIRTILFFDVTRFGRSWKDTLSTYFALSDQGYDLVFTLQPFLRLSFFYEMFKDLEEPLRTYMAETSFYKMFLEFAMRAEFESVMTSVRTKKGLEKARAKGKRIGRAPLPEKVRRRIIELYEQGKTYAEIQGAIMREGTYIDSKGNPRAPSLGAISNIIAEWEQSKRNKEKVSR